MSDINTLVDQLGNLTVLQIADLVKALEEKWGVSAAAPVAVAAVGGAAAGAPAASKRFAQQSPDSDLPRPRPSSRALPSPSRKALPRKRPKRSRRRSRPPAPRSRSSNLSKRITAGHRAQREISRVDTVAGFAYLFLFHTSCTLYHGSTTSNHLVNEAARASTATGGSFAFRISPTRISVSPRNSQTGFLRSGHSLI
jgi:Ribosomal protein L7/L12 dimerisation domain